MRKSIEKLAWELERDTEIRGNGTSLGEVAEKYGEDLERIMDALDVVKIVRREPTQIPAVEW